MSPIRRATLADAAHVAELEQAASHHPWSLTSIRDHLGLATTVGWVCAEGHILTSIVADEAEILTLAVAPHARRQGIGRQLVDRAMAHWQAHGVTRGLLEVRASNHAAIALYEHSGWVPCGHRPGYYAGPEGSEDALLMERRWSTMDGS